MLGNLIEASISTVTAGSPDTFTLADVAGSPNFNDVFGSSGSRFVRYTAIQYTSSARTEISKAQTGIGSVDLSTLILTQTLIESTWDASGPTYDDTDPAELTFTAGADTTRVYCSPVAEVASPFSLPFFSEALGDSIGAVVPNGSNLPSGTAPTLNIGGASGIGYFPLPWTFTRAVDTFTMRLTAARAGASASTLGFAVYEIGSNGLPGKRLAHFEDTAGNLLASSAPANVGVTAGTPFKLPPGMYIGAWYQTFTGGSGTPAWQAWPLSCPSPFGASLGATRGKSIPLLYKTGATLDDPADTASLSEYTEGSTIMVAIK